MFEYDSVAHFWRSLVPAYQSRSLRGLHATFPFAGVSEAAPRIISISQRRASNRIANYASKKELERVRSRLEKRARDVSIRFGVRKKGHGYSGERGDFCLVGGVYSGSTLTLFYRSIELIGGFAYDLALIDHVCREIGIEPKKIEIFAVRAFVFALKGNSNEKLYPKLKGVFDGEASEAARIPRGPVRRRSSR